jgi:hypothetical protein
MAELPHIVRAKDRGAFRKPAFVEDQRVYAGSAHAKHIPIRVDSAPLNLAGQPADGLVAPSGYAIANTKSARRAPNQTSCDP